ncbi:MAG: hypothetical protein ACE5KM_24280 [Planctomycetaceae bacterium]
MPRSLVTIDDFSNAEIEAVFALADSFLEKMADPQRPYCVRGKTDLAGGRILATLFDEPSTRTRLSFESAMHRLGGSVISAPDGRTSSSSKGETLADTVRVVDTYADLIVIRHPWEGAAQIAADFAQVPVINAGDGAHEHPTQTLCDLYTLRVGQRKKDPRNADKPLKDLLRELTIVLCGDLRHGRTVHSLVYALARFGARIIPLPASEQFDFPDHVRRRLARDYNCFPLAKKDLPENASLPADVLYFTPEKPHQLSLWQPDTTDFEIRLSKKEQRSLKGIKDVDVFYATRLQAERKEDGSSNVEYPVVDSAFLKQKPYRHSRVMHPLPRVDELGYDIDRDERGIYFQQAAYGVPVRMALMTTLLELAPGLSQEAAAKRYPLYERDGGIECINGDCVSAQTSERRYLKPRFHILEEMGLTLRCAYCDHEQSPGVMSRASTKKYRTDVKNWREVRFDDLLFFANDDSARRAGHQPRKTATRHAPVDQPVST